MTPPRKIAFISPAWTTWQHRLMSGALRYADAHPRILLRGFAPISDVKAAARELEAWGAEGAFGVLEYDDLNSFLGALKRPIPLVNNALTNERAGVVAILGDFTAFVETAVGHLRQLGLRSLAILVLEEGPQMRENLVETFFRVTKPPNPDQASLVFAADRDQLWHPETSVVPVPEPLAKWLQELPKPAGVLCCHLGGGGYLIRCCQALGLRVPDDIAVVGSDDTDLSLASEPTLTSVLLSLDTVGFEALRILTNMIAGEPAPSGIVRLRCADLNVRESTGLRRPQICDIAGALKCIEEHACRGIKVEEVIRQTQRVSKVTFHRHFMDAVGMTPGEAIRKRKLQEVKRLLTGTELPVTMVADLSGFSTPKELARVFRVAENTTPRDYRKRRQPNLLKSARRGKAN
jgi:LacI family transcriptional regulator